MAKQARSVVKAPLDDAAAMFIGTCSPPLFTVTPAASARPTPATETFGPKPTSLPERPRNRSLLRLRLPRGMKVNSASVGSQSLAIAPDGETIDLSALHGRVTVTAGIGK